MKKESSVNTTSYRMSKVHGKDTLIELKVRKALFKCGFRFRKNVATLPGTPDIVLKKYKTVIFINGCFWHNHKNCNKAQLPKTNVDFWLKKFERNKRTDERNYKDLIERNWKVIVVWECELGNHIFEETFDKLIKEIIG